MAVEKHLQQATTLKLTSAHILVSSGWFFALPFNLYQPSTCVPLRTAELGGKAEPNQLSLHL